MTSVEKRRSSRKSGGHRKHSDGGFSDASSGGSFLDETDREVSNLTDRAFRSLCIGEEAVYNDSDLSLSSPSIQRDRQLAFNQGRDIEERDREEQKRAACENFSLRVQQYEQDWILGGMYGAEIHGDPQWQVYGERTQGMVSATFQQSLVETSQQGKSLREGELSFFSNGATDLSSSQQRRSHSRVSSLVQAFNSERHTDGARNDNNLREWSDGTSWDRSALMSIQRELSEFSTSYQQNFDSHHFPSTSLFSPQDTNFCSPYVGANQLSHNSASSYMRSSQVRHNMSAQVSCNSNFFIHSEFSPFKLWRDHNRFPFQQGNISGFMQRSEFPKWYETPMYNELSLENQSHGPYRDLRHPRNSLGLTAPPTRSTSTSTMLQKASAMEKRCESELAGHYPHRKWTESLGTNKLPSQRPSTASPTTEMSRRVRDTISSVKALQQKIKMMSEQNLTTDVMTNQMNQGVGIYGNENWINRGNNAVTLGPNVVSTGQLLTPSIHAHRETEMLSFQQHEVSPQPVEHPPVRAESRGATPDIRTSSYKSRATSLLFNLKDNRKRVKSTYSPAKFKGSENQEKNKQPLMQESCDSVMNIHGFTGSDTQSLQQDPRRTAVNQYNSSGSSLTAQNCQPERANINQYSDDYQTAQTQGQMVHHMGFSGFIPEHYTNNQLANGQNPHEHLASFTPYKQDCSGSMEQLQQSYSATDTARLNTDNSESREYLISLTNSEQAFNETVGRVFSKVERYEQMKENKQNYKNVSSQDTWRQTNSQESDSFSLKTAMSQSKQGTASLTERSREENQSSRNKELQEVESREGLAYGTSLKKADLVSTKQQEGQQMNEDKNSSYKYTDQDHRNQNNVYPTTDKHVTMPKNDPMVGKQIDTKLQGEIPENTPAPTHQIKDRPSVERKDEEVTTKLRKGQNYKAEETKTQRVGQVEQPIAESVGFIPAEKTGSDHFKTEKSKLDPTKPEGLKQAKEEQIKENRKEEPEGTSREKELEQDGGKQIRVQQLDEINNIKEKDEHEHWRKEPEHAETEKLREERIKTKVAKTEEAGMARTQQAKVEEVTGKMINLERVQREQSSTKKVVEEKMEEEQIKTENPQTEQFRKAEQTKHMEATEIKGMEAETELMKIETVKQVQVEKDSSHVGKINLDKPTTLAKDTELKETNTKQAKLEGNKVDQSKAGISPETQNLTETSDKLTAAQPVRKEPDKVEQVKSELAKAKAELAKIKEKMRGEQREKVKINPAIKENYTPKKQVKINIEENKDSKKQEESAGMLTHTEANDYERLREKYGYANTNRNQTTAQGSLILHDENKAEVLPLKESGAGNNEKSKREPSLANTENIEEVSSFTHCEMTSSEKSKELKLSNIISVHTNICNEVNGDSIVDKLKDDSGQKLEKCDSGKSAQQRDSNLDKLHPPERKPESNEQIAGASTDLPVTSSRALLHRTQTKQEILTSKIKAHAEKEISAIKEKGLALRDGFIGKSSAKHLASGVNIRQKPPSKEVPKKHEALNNNPLKHLMELSEVQKEPAKFAPVPSSATVTVTCATNTQLVEHLDNPAEPIHTAKNPMSITESKIQKEVGIMSKVQSKEQAKTKDNQEKEQTNHTDVPGRQKEERQQEKSCEILSESKADKTLSTGVKAANPKPLTTAKDGTKEANQDSGSQNGQKEAAVTEDSLEIVGIMVTIRERFPNVDTDQGNTSTGKQRSTAEKECNKSEEDESPPRQGQQESTASKESSLIKAKDKMKSPSVVKEDPAKVKENNNPDNAQKTLILETKMRNIMENAAARRTNLQQKPTANIEPRGETEPEHVTAHAKGKSPTDTQTVPFKQNTNVKEAKSVETKSVKENLVQSTEEKTRDKETNLQQMQAARMNKNSTVSNSGIKSKAEPSIKEPSVKDLSGINSSKSRNINGQSAPPPEEKVLASTRPKPFTAEDSAENEKLSFNEEQSKEANQDVNVHIESIAIRVVSSATEEENISDEHRLKSFPSASGEQKMEESLEDKLAVQHVLSSVRKLSDSLKASSKQNSTNANKESNKSEPAKPELNVLPVEGDYFQVQGVTETDNRPHSNLTTAEDQLKEIERPALLQNGTSNELSKERKNEAFVFSLDQREKKSSDEDIKKTNQETEDNLSSTQTDGSTERQINTEKREAGQFNHTKKHHKENQSNLSAKERQSSRDPRSKTLNPVPEKSEPKPKPKGRTSTIPEISAIADYARLKVIVSEDKEETAPQEFPPNKKEGFFPLIQTRHSRRPVFTDDPQDLSVKDKKLPKRTEMTAKVSKEPKAIVFPITEKGHQRTGMFKLGDKQRPEQVNAGLQENMETNPSTKETNSSPTAQTGTKILDPSTCQPNNHETAPSSASNRANNSSEELTYLDENLLLNLGKMHHRKENTSHPEKQESPEKQKDKHTGTGAEDGRTDKFKKESLTNQHEEIKAKQQGQKHQSEKEKVFRCEKKQGEEDRRIKHMLEESRASLAEEEREAIRREEERRAKEREAVNIMVKERREKHRQSETRAGEEIKHKLRDEHRVVQKEEEVHTKQKVDPIAENGKKRRIMIEDEERAKFREEENKKLKQQGKEKTANVGQQRRIAEEEQTKAAQVNQQRRKSVNEEQRRRPAEEEQERRAAEEKKQETGDRTRRAIHEEHQRRTAEEQRAVAQVEQQRRIVQEEQIRKSAQEEQQRRAIQEEKQQRAAQEQQRRAVHVEQQGRTAEEEQRRAAQMEQQWRQSAHEEQRRRAAEEEQQQRAAQEEQQRKAVREEQQRRAAQVEQQRRTVKMEQQKRAAQQEHQQRAAEIEQQQRAAQEEHKRRAAEIEQQQRASQEDQQQRAAEIEQQRKAAHMEKQKRAAEEQHQRAAQKEQQRKAVQMEQQKRAAQEEQQQRAAQIALQQRAAQEEHKQRAAEIEQQQRAAQEEQQQRAAEIALQQRAAQEEHKRRAAKIEQQQRAAQEEHKRRAAEIEQQQKAAQAEQKRRAEEKEQQQKAAQEEQQQRAAQIEQQQRAAQEEQKRRAAKIEQQQRAAQEEQQRRTADKQKIVFQVEQQTKVTCEERTRNAAEIEQRRVAQIEQQRRLTQEAQLRKSAHEEQHRKYVQGEKQRRDLQEVQQKRAAHEEQQRGVDEYQTKSGQEKQQRGAAQVEEQKQAKQINDKIADDILEEWKRKPNEDKRTALLPGEQINKQIQEQKTEELRKERSTNEQWIKPQKEEEEDNGTAENEETIKQRVEKQAKPEDAILIARHTEAQELRLTKREADMHDDKSIEDDKRSAVHREKAKAIQTEKQTKEAPRPDALQYYAITSSNTEKKPRERQLSSPVASQLTHNQLAIESSDDSEYHTRPHRPHAAASPASSLPRSNTSSPALGGKPLMFRVKDNTIRGSSLTKSIKPRFHKNFGEDFWMGSPSDRTEDEQEVIRRSAGTPIHPDRGVNQFSAMSESSALFSACSLQDYSTSMSHQRPYSRRSMALDDDESRSVISNMSEDVESFATNATDVADVRGLFDYERPESACSFSSDVSRSLGKPPVVPPKSEKALRRAQRLTSRRMKKELSKAAGGSPAGVEEKVSSFPSSTEVCSSSNHAVASPHCSPPIAFAHAPSLGSSLPSSHTEHQPSHHSFHASPHATGPISLPISSPHVSSTVSLPSVSHHASAPTSKPAAPKTVAHVSSSSTPHLINPHSTPVTQYHVEPSHYPQSYPLTQHKVLQDLGSGQYFVVEVPVQVKTKTFFDPETGKYVQLNVRQSGQNISQPQHQQTYPQPQLQPQIKSQQQPLSQGSLTGKPFVFYPAYQGYPQSHQPAVINSVHTNRSSAPATLHQDQQPPRECHTSTEVQQTSEERRYSPEKTPYMDTVNDTNRTYNPINSTQEAYEFETNSQLGSSVCENDNSANSLCQPRDIIAMSELEDFMEISDW